MSAARLDLEIRSNAEIGVVPPVATPLLVIRRDLLTQKVSGQSDSADMTSVFLDSLLLHFGDFQNDYTSVGCMWCLLWDGISSFLTFLRLLRYALFYFSFISVVVL